MAIYPIDGDKRHQKSARLALPLLVRQAHAGEPIYYSDLAPELNYSNSRNLNYPLGAIGETLIALGEDWGEEIPQIQALVINKNKGIPGSGIAGFLDKDFNRLSQTRQREIVKAVSQKIILYPRWQEVLKALDLMPVKFDFKKRNKAAAKRPRGEGETHKKFKAYVAKNPSLLGAKAPKFAGDVEVALPSGDSLDVSFDAGGHWVAVEVKTAASPEADIIRGIYQCVKYTAVMQAMQTSEDRERDVRVVLMLEGKLPENLLKLKNVLGVEVIDNVDLPNLKRRKE